jgi:nitroreductase
LAVFEAIEKRHSVRSFEEGKDVAGELVKRLVRYAYLAPSAGNVQPWRFMVIRDSEIKRRLSQAALGRGFVAAAIENLLLAATSLGLGACWVGAFREEASKVLSLRQDLRPVALMPVGYPRRQGSQPHKTNHKKLTKYIG